FAPTFAAIAGAAAPDFVDGRSLLPLLGAAPPATASWRQAFLIMHGDQDDDDDNESSRLNHLLEPPDDVRATSTSATRAIPPFSGLRTADYKLVEYENGERELCNIRADPYELQNIASTSDRALVDRLSSWLNALSHCAAANCRTLDLAPR